MYLSHLAPPHKLLPYPCPICNGKFGTAQVVVLNGILRHGIKHPDFRLESKNYERAKKSFLQSLQNGNELLYTCYNNNLLFRIYHYSSEKYDDVKKQMEPKWWKKDRKKIKKAYGKEIHSFRTRYDIKIDYKSNTKIYRIPLGDIFLDPSHFHLKRNQKSRSWALNENSKGEFKKLYEMIKEDGWYCKEPMSGVLARLYST